VWVTLIIWGFVLGNLVK